MHRGLFSHICFSWVICTNAPLWLFTMVFQRCTRSAWLDFIMRLWPKEIWVKPLIACLLVCLFSALSFFLSFYLNHHLRAHLMQKNDSNYKTTLLCCMLCCLYVSVCAKKDSYLSCYFISIK